MSDADAVLNAFVEKQSIARRIFADGEEHQAALVAGVRYGIERRLGDAKPEGTPLRDRMRRWSADGGDANPRDDFLTGYYLSASVPVELARAVDAKRAERARNS